MIIAVFGVVLLTAVVAFLVVMRVQAKLQKMTGGARRTEHFEFEMAPLPPPAPESAVASLQPITPAQLVALAEQQSRYARENPIPPSVQSAVVIHVDDRDDLPTLTRKLYSLTDYITTPYSPTRRGLAGDPRQEARLRGDIVIVNIATDDDHAVPVIQRLLLLNNQDYPRLFFVCRGHDGALQPFQPFANQLTTFRLPFFKYAPIADKRDDDPEYSVYFGASNVYETPAIYAEPNDENVICIHYSAVGAET